MDFRGLSIWAHSRDSSGSTGEGNDNAFPSTPLTFTVLIPGGPHPSLVLSCVTAVLADWPTTRDGAVIVLGGDALGSIGNLLLTDARVHIYEGDPDTAWQKWDELTTGARDDLLFLAPDAHPEPGALAALLRYADAHPGVAVIGGLLLNPGGMVRQAGLILGEGIVPRPRFPGFSADHPALAVSGPVPMVAAGAMLVRRVALAAVGGFDRTLTDGYRDADLCLRLGAAGQSVHLCIEASFTTLTDPFEGGDPAAFRARWVELLPDDVQLYARAGLISLQYVADSPPAVASVPPVAATLPDDHTLASLLDARARAVGAFQRENVELLLARDDMAARDTQDPIAAIARTRLRAFLARGDTLAIPISVSPRVSVVIPAHNQAAFTFLALESLAVTEAGAAFEVIVTDDASTDETATLLAHVTGIRVVRLSENAGFGVACNRGANVARGEFLCFLNNDTLVTAGWLGALVAELDHHPTVGAAGTALVGANGRLQEAGCIVCGDGSTLGYGAEADPTGPAFAFAREVDYCSAACLLVRRELFAALNGFDDYYRPAYYEDVDLCFRLTAAGHPVRYAAGPPVIHLTHGSSTRMRALTLTLRNRRKFVARWADTLVGRPLPDEIAVSGSDAGAR